MVSYPDFSGFRAQSLSFIEQLYEKNNAYYLEFHSKDISTFSTCEAMIRIMESIRDDIANGWFFSFKDSISDKIFSDYLDMAKYLLDREFKDASAVIIGFTLEIHLRYLCEKNEIEIKKENGESKNANSMNDELKKKNVYNESLRKSIASWLEIRNNAAHGKCNEYNKNQVDNMYSGVNDFINNTIDK
jgi:hypothetical protein